MSTITQTIPYDKLIKNEFYSLSEGQNYLSSSKGPNHLGKVTFVKIKRDLSGNLFVVFSMKRQKGIEIPVDEYDHYAVRSIARRKRPLSPHYKKIIDDREKKAEAQRKKKDLRNNMYSMTLESVLDEIEKGSYSQEDIGSLFMNYLEAKLWQKVGGSSPGQEHLDITNEAIKGFNDRFFEKNKPDREILHEKVDRFFGMLYEDKIMNEGGTKGQIINTLTKYMGYNY